MKPLTGEERRTPLYRTRTTTRSGGNWIQAIVIRDYDGTGGNNNDDESGFKDIRLQREVIT